MKQFTPEIISPTTVTFAVEVYTCGKCCKGMVSHTSRRYAYGASTFPVTVGNSFKDQATRAGLLIQSDVKVDDAFICTNCKDGGLADFLCALCLERKSTSKHKESFGDPPESLCSDCYATIPANLWDNKVNELINIHQYDFE